MSECNQSSVHFPERIMIFTVILLYSCLFLESLVNCASVELGSQHLSPASLANDDHQHVALSNSNHSSISSRSSKNASIISSHVGEINPSPLATTSNGPPEDLRRRLKPRQVSPSEWIFSTLVQPQDSSAAGRGQQQPPFASQNPNNRRGNSLTYRSIAPSVSSSNYYTNYYRNHNIYSQQTGRRIDGGEDKHNIHDDGKEEEQFGPEAPSHHLNTGVTPEGGLGRRRASSLPFAQDGLYATQSGVAPPAATSKTPEVISSPHYSGTTGLSKTAPATDPTLLGTEERATSTQEMQISDDDIELGSRAEIGGRGRKRGREMTDGAATSLYFQESDSAPIIFPGSSTTSSSSNGNKESNLRAYTRPSIRTGTGGSGGGRKSISTPWPAITLNPSDKRHIDGWNKLHELRQKSKSMQDGRKSGIASDTSADAKIISILNIENTPRCAQGNGYCEEIDGYPKSFFNQVLNKTLNLAPDVFQDIFGETTDNNSIFTDVEYSLRDGFDETPLCSVREHTIYPKAAQNRRGKFMYIVNHDEYLQGIRVETCTREKDGCMFTEGHLPGYSSTCRQKYIYKKLLAFSPDGKAMPDTFRLPSCCVCYVKSMFISDRINPVVDLGGANSDIQPTVAADEGSWSPGSSSTISYPSHPHHDDSGSSSSMASSTEPGGDMGSITFPSTSNDDLSTYQVPSPTTSTLRTTLDGGTGGESHQNGGQQQNRAENQTASRRLH